MRRILPILIFILLSFTCIGQDFREGSVVLNNGDTIKGSILYRENNYKDCLLKSKDGVTNNYTPDEVLSYGFIGGQQFESKYLLENKKVFARIYIKGTATLLEYEGNFFVEKDTLVQQLVYDKRIETINGTPVEIESKKYIGTLNFLFSDCPSVQKQINRTRFTAKELYELFKNYNECIGTVAISFDQNTKWIEARFLVFSSFNMNSYQFNTSNPFNSYLEPKLTCNSPAFGLGVELAQSKENERVSLRIEAWYTSYDFYRKRPDESNGIFYDTDEFSLTWKEVKVPILFKYQFLPKNSPYFLLGWSTAFLFDGYVERKQEKIGGPIKISAPSDFKKFNFAINGGAGYSKSLGNSKAKMIFECRYSYANGVLKETASTTSNNQTLQFLLGLIF